MGAECSNNCDNISGKQEEYQNGQGQLKLQDPEKQVKIVADKISKNRIEAEFPTLPPHIQSRIDKLSKHQKYLKSLTLQQQKLQSHKIYRCKLPFNFIYMNLQDRPESYPIGKCIIYKLKQRDQFAGYFEGTLTQNFTISPQNVIIVFSNGCYFEGLSKQQGRYLNENTGLKYEGGWGNQMPDKFGKEKNNKGYYEGGYQNGQKKGNGKFIWNNGSIYQGEFLKGLFNGQGRLVDQNQKYQYEGQFKNGEKHGSGKQKTSKQIYTGQFQYGFRSGFGKLQLLEDDRGQRVSKVYQGQFYDNRPNGKGELIVFENGEVKDKIKAIWTKGNVTSVLSIL